MSTDQSKQGGNNQLTDKEKYMEALRIGTEQFIDKQTADAIETEDLVRVINKIHTDAPWVTIKGAPGVGKSMLGYMALKKLRDEGRPVFIVRYPGEFDLAIRIDKAAILLDDTFGRYTFDIAQWNCWQGVIQSYETRFDVARITGVTVVLAARIYVVNCGTLQTESAYDHTVNSNIVDVGDKLKLKDKEALLKAIQRKHKVDLTSSNILKICEVSTIDAFPQISELFFDAYKKDPSMSAVDFFQKPLDYLKLEMNILFKVNDIKTLFLKMIKLKDTVEKMTYGTWSFEHTNLADSLTTYVKIDDFKYTFKHPAIMECAAGLLWETDKTFVKEHFSPEIVAAIIKAAEKPPMCQLAALNKKRMRAQNGAKPSNVTEQLTPHLKNVQESSEQIIDLYTKGTKETAALKVILQKVKSGYPWITVTGFPGEGKSVLCYQLLRKLKDEGRSIYVLKSLDKFNLAIQTDSPVIVLDSVFSLSKSEDVWKEWKDSFALFLQRVIEGTASGSVILNGRDVEFKSASRLWPDPWCLLSGEDVVVNISHIHRSTDEKTSILKSLATLRGVDLTNTDLKEVFKVVTTPGFPQVCASFVGHLKKHPDLSAVEYFRHPLSFLKNPMELMRTSKEKVLGNLVKYKNSLPMSVLQDLGPECIDAASDLSSYVKLEDGVYSFQHIAMYICMSLIQAEFRLKFIVENSSDDILKVMIQAMEKDRTVSLDPRGSTFLHSICYSEQSYGFAKRLLDVGTDINAIGKDGNTPLHNACQTNIINKDTIQLLLKSGSVVNIVNDKGNTPLHCANDMMNEYVVPLFMQSGADVNIANQNGETSLHRTCHVGTAVSVEHVLKAGANVNARNIVGMTPLNYVFLRKDVDINCIQVMLEAGADANCGLLM